MHINLKCKDIRPKRLLTLLGYVTYNRRVYVPADEKSHELFYSLYHKHSYAPLDDYLNITTLPYKITVLMMLKFVRMGIQYPSYQAMSTALKNHDDIPISDDELRYVMNYVATFSYINKLYEAKTHLRLLCDYKNSHTEDVSAKTQGLLYLESVCSAHSALERYLANERVIMPDFLNRESIDIDPLYEDFDSLSQGEVSRAVTIFSDRNIVRLHSKTAPDGEDTLLHRDVIICGRKETEFMQLICGTLAKEKLLEHEGLVMLGDGSCLFYEFSKVLKDILPKNYRVVTIIDYAILENFILDCAKQTFKSQRGLRAFAKELLSLLCEGKYKRALDIIAAREIKDNEHNLLYAYFIKNREALNYAAFLKKGYRIGAGSIEKQERRLFENRLLFNLHSRSRNLKQNILNLMLAYDCGNFHHEVGDAILKAFSEGNLPVFHISTKNS